MLVHACDRHPDEIVAGRPLPLALDGEQFEIDVCSACESKLLDALSLYVENARKASNGAAAPRRRRQSRIATAVVTRQPTPAIETPSAPSNNGDVPASGITSSSLTKEERANIRTWANSNGYTVGPRGSIAQKIIDHYFATTG